MSARASIAQINVSARGGVPKHAVPRATVTELGLEGDTQRDRRYHGGPERALCLFPLEHIQALRGEGHTITPGAIGENVTVVGLDWARIVPGSRLELGDQVVVEVTRYTSPCFNIKPSFSGGDYSRVSQKTHPGWSRVYARVLRTGDITQGDRVRLLDAS